MSLCPSDCAFCFLLSERITNSICEQFKWSVLLLVCRDPAFLDPAVETQELSSIIRGPHRAFKNNIQRYRLGKVLDALHGRIDRPTPKRHCIDKFEESHERSYFLTLVFLCPNRTLHQLGAFLNEIFLVIPAAGTRNMGVTQHCIYFMKTHVCLSNEY